MTYSVLLVDDSSLMRRLVRRSLELIGCDITDVFEAESGQEGIDRLAEVEPDLILCDWNMPSMDGGAFARHVVGRSGVPIIMMAVDARDSVHAAAMAAGAKLLLNKPVRRDRLQGAVRALLDVS